MRYPDYIRQCENVSMQPLQIGSTILSIKAKCIVHLSMTTAIRTKEVETTFKCDPLVGCVAQSQEPEENHAEYVSAI